MKLFFSILLSGVIFAQTPKVIKSTSESIIVEFTNGGTYQLSDTLLNGKIFQKIIGDNIIPNQQGEPLLPQEYFSLGVKKGTLLSYKILSDQKRTLKNKFLVPYTEQLNSGVHHELYYSEKVYQANQEFPINLVTIYPAYDYRFATVLPIGIYPFQFNPVTREIILHEKVVVEFFYKNQSELSVSSVMFDQSTDEFLKENVLNYAVAKNWTKGKTIKKGLAKIENNYWYNPLFKWFKLYLKNEGIYRISYSELVNTNANDLQNIDINKLQLFNDGEEVPLEVNDDGDSIFNKNDYIQFVGKTVSPSPYCKQNIYNNSNIYWLTLNSDLNGKRYKEIEGNTGGWERTFLHSVKTVHYEKDLLYEHLGYAPDSAGLKRDFWYWGKASGANYTPSDVFVAPFPGFANFYPDSNIVTLRINLHGLTNYGVYNPEHRAKIFLTSQLIDSVDWDGQNYVNFEKKIDTKTISIFPDNNLQVSVDGALTVNRFYPVQSLSDDILINWFEFDFWVSNIVNGSYFHFVTTPEMYGKNRFSLERWKANDMEIYIPQRGEVIKNPFFTLNQYEQVLFVDSADIRTDYYCTSLSNYLSVDSIKIDVSSQLRNKNQGVDYLIITHSNFLPAAERLRQFRETHFPDTSIVSPRIKITDIEDIYDEFSFGLLDPNAVKSYIKYAFENYLGTPVSYVVLIGDMSSDYRGIFPESRKNYIPSLSYHSREYGLAASDNMFAAVSGDDVAPDVAIGRLSCETLDEANILIDKIVSYPSDPGKGWRRNSLLVASGQDLDDERFFGFNDASLELDRNFLTPNGFSSKKVFRYPSKPIHVPFQGEGAEIRKGIDSGAVLVNYYGHGGGYQWDLIFLNDDIYMLNNEGRLPFVSSITCYTAHFDNQNVFGEQFVKVPGKGAIAFWGSSGLTVFGSGKYFNERFFNQVFKNKNYIIGKAILYALAYNVSSGSYADQIALSTLLGDPLIELAFPKVPDYSVSEDLVGVSQPFPIIDNPVQVKIYVNNLGIIQAGDSLSVELSVMDKNVKTLIGTKKISSFGIQDSVVFLWTPRSDGANTLFADINQDRAAREEDFSDNQTTKSVYVYKTSEPNSLSPINGFTAAQNKVEFRIADIGEFVGKKLMYQVQVDTALEFENPITDVKNLSPIDGVVKWTSASLPVGSYYWHVRSWEGLDSSNWTQTSTFTVNANVTENISFTQKQLNLFESENLIYSDSLKGLLLNASILPAKPINSRYVGKLNVTLPSGLSGLTAMTTDGKYIYVSSMFYYNGQKSKIYKIGTGNGSQEGQLYGEVSPFAFSIKHTMFYLNGKIYIAEGDVNSLLEVDVQSGDTSSVFISGKLLNENALETDGGFYLCSDGRYVYDLAVYDTLGEYRYRLRILDPQNNWSKVGEDKELPGTSYNNFSSFFVIDQNLYAFEYGYLNYMRRYNLSTDRFEEEWIAYTPFQGYFAWAYNVQTNLLYASVYHDGFQPRIAKFLGKYKNTEGSVVTSPFGPAKKWNSVSYAIEKKVVDASANVQLEKFNSTLQQWETLKQNIPTPYLLDTLKLADNSLLRLVIDLKDTSTTSTNAFNLSRIGLNYTEPTELSIPKNGVQFAADTLLQGFPLEFQISPENISSTPSDTFQVACYLDDAKIPFYTSKTALKGDSSITFNSTLETAKIGDQHKIKVELTPDESETYSFNNFIEKTFFIKYDTLRPTLKVLIDGKEILDGDIVSKEPDFEVSLTDNSPLPISKYNFSVAIDNVPLDVANIRDSIIPYPNNETVLKWKELSLKQGEHILNVFAKDSSGNYFDNSVREIAFSTYSENDIKYIYNYPNPFSSQTHFTFELRGERKPEEIAIRIFTIAGRLIKEIKPSSSDYSVGFNKIFWDGKDQDGDPIANGLYLYKLIAKFADKTITASQKLVKME